MNKIAFAILALFAASAHAEGALKASFTDAAWDGNKIPAGQQCARFDGKGARPA